MSSMGAKKKGGGGGGGGGIDGYRKYCNLNRKKEGRGWGVVRIPVMPHVKSSGASV